MVLGASLLLIMGSWKAGFNGIDLRKLRMDSKGMVVGVDDEGDASDGVEP